MEIKYLFKKKPLRIVLIILCPILLYFSIGNIINDTVSWYDYIIIYKIAIYALAALLVFTLRGSKLAVFRSSGVDTLRQLGCTISVISGIAAVMIFFESLGNITTHNESWFDYIVMYEAAEWGVFLILRTIRIVRTEDSVEQECDYPDF